MVGLFSRAEDMKEEVDLAEARLEIARLARAMKEEAERVIAVAMEASTKAQKIVEDLDRYDTAAGTDDGAERRGDDPDYGGN